MRPAWLCLLMIATQAPHLAFQKFLLRRPGPLNFSLQKKKISKSRNGS
jgi:hypothetical protein